MRHEAFDQYWYSWHLRQEEMYKRGETENDRAAVFEYCVDTFREIAGRVETVIELGVGNAFLLNHLSRIHPDLNYYGIDINRPILERNSRKYPHLKFIHGNAVEILESIDRAEGIFVYALATLEYLTFSELDRLFGAVRQNCSQGVFLFSGVSGPDAFFTHKNSLPVKQKLHDTKYSHHYKKLVLRHGFPFLGGKIFHCLDRKTGHRPQIHVFRLGL